MGSTNRKSKCERSFNKMDRLNVILLLLSIGVGSVSAVATPSGVVVCTETGFSPTFSIAHDSADDSDAIYAEIEIGGSTSSPCEASGSVTSPDGLTLTRSDFKGSDAEIGYDDGTECSGTLTQTATKITYATTVDYYVTETLRSKIKRELLFKFDLSCELTRVQGESA